MSDQLYAIADSRYREMARLQAAGMKNSSSDRYGFAQLGQASTTQTNQLLLGCAQSEYQSWRNSEFDKSRINVRLREDVQ